MNLHNSFTICRASRSVTVSYCCVDCMGHFNSLIYTSNFNNLSGFLHHRLQRVGLIPSWAALIMRTLSGDISQFSRAWKLRKQELKTMLLNNLCEKLNDKRRLLVQKTFPKNFSNWWIGLHYCRQ